MIYERKFEERSRGLICGPATEVVGDACVLPIRRKRGDLFFGPARPISPEWRPWTKHYKVVISAREGGEVLWQRPFATEAEALFAYVAAIGIDTEPGRSYRFPSIWIDGQIEIRIATVTTFNATNTDSANDWNSGGNKAPSGVSSVEYLVIAGGAAGGGGVGNNGGGGGAGQFRTATGFGVTPSTSYTITVGAGGTGSTASTGASGANSVFSSITSTGGSGGSNGVGGASGNGYSGGTQFLGGNYPSGGGAGSSANGQNAPSGSAAGNGGAGTSSSITGSSVTDAGGGGGCINPAATAGTGTNGGGNGSNGHGNGSNATANTGGGGGGSSGNTSGSGGSGKVILSYASPAKYIFNSPMLGM